MSTLTAQSLQALPFAVLVKDGVIPGLDQIQQCVIRWKADPTLIVRAGWVLCYVNTEKVKLKTVDPMYDPETA